MPTAALSINMFTPPLTSEVNNTDNNIQCRGLVCFWEGFTIHSTQFLFISFIKEKNDLEPTGVLHNQGKSKQE